MPPLIPRTKSPLVPMTRRAEPISLHVTKLAKHFSSGTRTKHVLTDISFSANAGQTTMFLGANGAGKSTLLRCIGGLLLPDAGEITGTPTEHQTFYLGNPERFFYNRLTLQENIDFFAPLWNTPTQKVIHKFLDALARFGIDDVKNKPFFSLSSGQKKKVTLSFAFALPDIQIYLLDEPFQNLDAAGITTLTTMMAEYSSAIFLCANPDKPERLQASSIFQISHGELHQC